MGTANWMGIEYNTSLSTESYDLVKFTNGLCKVSMYYHLFYSIWWKKNLISICVETHTDDPQ
jgi:hypothetical protein